MSPSQSQGVWSGTSAKESNEMSWARDDMAGLLGDGLQGGVATKPGPEG
jgi:hypothetical protein